MYQFSIQYYNEKKRNIVKFGASKPLVVGKSKISIHAEELAIKFCLSQKLDAKYTIYIWRWSKDGKLKPKYCCSSCTNLAKKYKFTDRIFTFDNGHIKNAIDLDNTYTTIGNIIRNNK